MSVELASRSGAVTGTPAMPDVGVTALVAERWGTMWLSRHQILTRLARYFNVVWVDPPRTWRQSLTGPRPVVVDATPPPSRGFSLYRHGPLLPKFYRPPGLRRATERARLARVRQRLARAGARRFILYVWRPSFAEALDLARYDTSCYHIADEYSFATDEQPLSPAERRLIERVDQVFVHSPALLEKKGRINPHTAYVTNGVDYDAFAGDAPEPADLAAIPHPRIGYVGRLKSQLDWDTLMAIATRRPDWSLVMVGPIGHMGDKVEARERLFAMPNVHYLGNRSVGEIPGYTQHMDVCLLCYALTDYTRYIFPLKLHEYLAGGRPVVGSDIRTLREFPGVVKIAHDSEQWVAHIEASLAPGEMAAGRIEERRRVARAYDWNVLTETIAATLCERLGNDYARRFAALARMR